MAWQGMNEAQTELSRMENKIIASLPGAATAAAAVFWAKAKQLAPAATGRLRRNINMIAGRRTSRHQAEAHVYLSKRAFYGAILESEKFKRRQPFMQPAIKMSIQQMERAIERHIMSNVKY